MDEGWTRFIFDENHIRIHAFSMRTSARVASISTSMRLCCPTIQHARVGSASSDSPATVTVANSGYDPTSTNPLTFSGVSTGTTSFVLDAANACSTSTSLEPGQTCALSVDFTPQVSGTPLTDAVTLADNNLNNISSAASPQNVSLSGNGLQQTPGVTVPRLASVTACLRLGCLRPCRLQELLLLPVR